MKFTKILAIALAVAMLFTFFTGCGTASSVAPVASSEAPVTPAETVTVVGVVEEASLSQMVVALEDGTSVALDIKGVENIGGIELGDTVEVEYTESADGNIAASVTVTKAAETPEVEDTVADDVPEVTPTPAEGEDSPSQAPAVEQPASTAPVASSTPAASAPTASQASTPAGISGMTPKQRAEAVFAGTGLEVYDWTTPAVISGNTSMGTSFSTDYGINGSAAKPLGDIMGISHQKSMMERLSQYGYNYELPVISLTHAFNDYRGVTTDYIRAMEGRVLVHYVYDEATGAFTKTYPNGGGSATSSTTKPVEPAKPAETPETESADVYEVIDLINEERVAAGLHELEIDDRLMEAADIRAEELSEEWAHTRPDGTDWYTILPEVGVEYGRTVENAGMRGATKGEAQVQQWMDSSGHKKNILEPKVTHIGVGNYNQYWIMISAEVKN